jgi:hypothetical protein
MTITVKNQNEFLLYYTFREIGVIGLLSIDDDGKDAEDYESKIAAMTQENQDALGGNYGSNLYVSMNAKAQGNKPVVLEVKGTDEADAEATVEVTIPARTQISQCIKIDDPAVDKKWKTITSILVKSTQPTDHEATEGTQFQLLILPLKNDFIADNKGGLINFDNSFSWSMGSTSRAVPNKFNPVDHYKRQRGENTINISQAYTVFGRSLEYLRDREFTLLAEGHENGSSKIFERRYFSHSLLTNVPNSAGSDGADLSMDADGIFRDMFVVE